MFVEFIVMMMVMMIVVIVVIVIMGMAMVVGMPMVVMIVRMPVVVAVSMPVVVVVAVSMVVVMVVAVSMVVIMRMPVIVAMPMSIVLASIVSVVVVMLCINRIDHINHRNGTKLAPKRIRNRRNPCIAVTANINEQIRIVYRNNITRCRLESMGFRAGRNKHRKLNMRTSDLTQKIILRKNRRNNAKRFGRNLSYRPNIICAVVILHMDVVVSRKIHILQLVARTRGER